MDQVLLESPSRRSPPENERSARHVHWIEDAQLGPVAPTLNGHHQSDVGIVGGGYLGLWTALSLKRLDPGLSVALVESEFCGFGASGRNGGIAQGWWTKIHSLQERLGMEAATSACLAADEALTRIGEEGRAMGVETFRPTGWLWTASDRAQLGAWDSMMAGVSRAGVEPFIELSRDQLRERTGSTRYLGGVLERSAGAVQPALLASVLRSSAEAAGVQLFERSPVSSLARSQGGMVFKSSGGELRADRVVLASGAWMARLRALRRSLFVVSSDMIATASDPHGFGQARIPTELALSDSRMQVNYMQATRDWRLVWGRGGGALGFANRVGEAMLGRPRRSPVIERTIRDFYPGAASPVRHGAQTSWSGPVDRSVSGLPLMGWLDPGQRIAFAAGFSGNGIAPTAVAGEELAKLVCGRASPLAGAFAPDLTGGSFPPEPIRFFGGIMIRTAVGQKERAESLDRAPPPLTRKLASLAPGGSKE